MFKDIRAKVAINCISSKYFPCYISERQDQNMFIFYIFGMT